MNALLQTSRRQYSEFFRGTILPILGLSEEASKKLGFLEIAQRIDSAPIRDKYRRLAIQLLEENLREHQAERPRAIELFDAKHIDELYEWQETSSVWEKALWSLVSQQ